MKAFGDKPKKVVFLRRAGYVWSMRWHLRLTVAVLLLGTWAAPALGAERILKVLPMLLDKDGLHTRSPNLFARDAYQVHLQRYPGLQSGMMYAIQLKARPSAERPIRLRLELRGVARGNLPRQLVVDSYLPAKGGSSRWVYLTLRDAERQYLGDVTAWRATLWDEGSLRNEEGQLLLLAEQKSFLW